MNKVIAPKWIEARQRWQVNATIDGQRRTFVSSQPGRKGQQECFSKMQAALNGKLTSRAKIKDIYPQFIEDVCDRTSTGNTVNLESIGRNWIIPYLGNKEIANLTEQDIQSVLNAAYKAGRSKKTIRNIRGAFTAFLRYARKAKLTTLRVEDVEIPSNAPVGVRKILNKDDIIKLFSTSETTYQGKVVDDFYINAYRLLVLTGMRPGELCELQRGNQSESGILAVTGAFNRFREHTEGKTGNAQREFLLTDRAAAVLRDQTEMLKAKGIVTPYLFPMPTGSQLDVTLLYFAWKRFKAHNNISDVSIYELRHTFVSIVQRTVPEPLIKPVIGHSSAMPSYQTYGHKMDGDAELVASMISERYDEIFSSKKNGTP